MSSYKFITVMNFILAFRLILTHNLLDLWQLAIVSFTDMFIRMLSTGL